MLQEVDLLILEKTEKKQNKTIKTKPNPSLNLKKTKTCKKRKPKPNQIRKKNKKTTNKQTKTINEPGGLNGGCSYQWCSH